MVDGFEPAALAVNVFEPAVRPLADHVSGDPVRCVLGEVGGGVWS